MTFSTLRPATRNKLAILKSLAASATRGPWSPGAGVDGRCRIYAPTEGHAIARTYGPELNGIGVCALTGPENVADAQFIAAARDALPWLIQLLEDATASDRSPQAFCTSSAHTALTPFDAAHAPQPTSRLMNQLRRFNECCEDFEAGGHDVDKEDMRALAELGAVRPAPGGRYYMTDFGRHLVTAPPPPAALIPSEDAYVAHRLTEVLAEVWATIMGDDAQPEDAARNAIDRVKHAAQVLRLEVDLYRAQRYEVAVALAADRAALKRAMDLLDAKIGDTDPATEGLTQDEVQTTYPVLAAMQMLSGLYIATTPDVRISDAVRDVLAERARQVSVEGWTPEHDDAHACGEIAAFAAVYAMPEGARDWPTEETGYGATLSEALTPDGWQPKFGDRRRDLVKAAALTLAEIERIDRAEKGHQHPIGGDHDGEH